MNNLILLIPHYNDPKGLLSALSSIGCNEKLDVIIVDDGSENDLLDEAVVLNSFTAHGRVFFAYLTPNMGIEHALNKGLDFILSHKQYKYIARLDCADKCLGERFKIQQDFLEAHPDIMLVSSNMICVDTEGNFLNNRVFPLDSDDIKKRMYVNNMFSHVASMFTVEAVREIGTYPLNYKAAEDYAFFFKFVKKYKTANLNQFLVLCEINPRGISYLKRNQQVQNRIRIIFDNFYFGFWPLYGLIRNCIIYILPFSIIQKIKRWSYEAQYKKQ
jgi:hypothetical protein